MKQNKVKEVLAYTHLKGANPVDFPKLVESIEKGRVTGYVVRDGLLSDNSSFADIRLIIKPENVAKEGKKS